MGSRMKYKILIGFFSFSVFAIACSGAYFLGKLYLGIITKGFVPQAVKVNADHSKSVSAEEKQETLMLNPVPVFFLQAGVYSDQQGVQAGMKPLVDLGYKPYATRGVPYKLWIGIFRDRAGAEPIKAALMEKGISSFTGSLVVNGNNLKYAKANEAIIKEVTPVLELYTQWLKENLQIFAGSEVTDLDNNSFQQQITVIEKIYDEISKQPPLKFNNDEMTKDFDSLRQNIEEYKSQLQVFEKERKQEQYAALQWKLLEFTDGYMEIIQKIDSISSKT